MPTTTPLTDAINALTTYANETTGASDTTLSAAVGTLVAGYGQGSVTDDDLATRNYSGNIVLNTTTTIQDWAFHNASISSISSNTVMNVNAQALSGCSSLTSISFPNMNGIAYGSAFANDPNLTTIEMPNINYLTNGYNFANDSKLTQALFPNYSHTGSRRTGLYVFQNCVLLNTVDFGKCTGIDANCFNGCANLTALVFRSASVCALGNVNAFTGTPFASGGAGGEIYVPSALISSYQTATNWSTINGYGTITWKAIEGSEWEL